MYFIYLPLWELFSPRGYRANNEHLSRGYVLKIIKELNVPLIDMHEQVFASHSDPLSLFPFRLSGHYNSEGYRLVAETIVKTLKSDGYVPTN